MEHGNDPRQLDPSPLGWLPDDPLTTQPRRKTLQGGRELRTNEPRTGEIIERWRLVVEGSVQGVGYREACRGRARELSLSGWVRNTTTGAVQIEAEGRIGSLSDLRIWCEHGPSSARVTQVTSHQIPLTGDDWFEIRR
ncbi:acylphosphatase [Synechococcus sp. RSCCF101]|uniref:acylphosphatase n=1 Tax=Synechococcus sp. RSCCF101 TaxID=2511069 RepID=UPI00124880C8|nr:acylphosphatase [Synechococcus sp. RSCCF101]QEY31038.1 acylphosphatase [Synechococcus sp. RSCCF101]